MRRSRRSIKTSVEEHLAELAHHYGRSANSDKAVEYLTRAGQQALSRSAFAEAQAQLQQGLEWIKKLPESPERDARELELASTLAQVLLVTQGNERAGDARGRRARPGPGREGWQSGPTGCTGLRDLA